MTLKELLSEFEKEYSHIAEVVEGLSEKQLSRKAHIPLLKERLWRVSNACNVGSGHWEYHLGSHIDHMKEILQAMVLPFA